MAEAEDVKVLTWRAEQLTAVGFNDLQAGALAAGKCDLHEATDLVKPVEKGGRGCPVDIAFDLLSE